MYFREQWFIHKLFQIELLDLIRAGVVGFKCFLIESGVEEFPNISPDELKTVLAVLNGTGSVLAVSICQCYGYNKIMLISALHKQCMKYF